MRIGPRHPRLGRAAYRLALPALERIYARRGIHRADSAFAHEQFARLRAKLASGAPLYLGGLCASGTHNSGVALIEVTRETGPRIICNNEEERFSGERHTTKFPRRAIAALQPVLSRIGVESSRIDGWFLGWDSPAFGAMMLRAGAEEMPQSLGFRKLSDLTSINVRDIAESTHAARLLGRELGCATPLIAMPHHDCHAWFSYCASPFASEGGPVLVSVIDGAGDRGSISLFLCQPDGMRELYCNDSIVDSLGNYYAVISSTQGGWTMLSSEGRYMGAAAWGDGDRNTNPFYRGLRDIFHFGPQGQVHLNRALANWVSGLDKPYTDDLIRILGRPIAISDMWNPDAVLRVEDIRHRQDTQERLDKAAATQMVFEDALIHILQHHVRETGADRLVLAGGTALNAVASMRLLDRFDEAWYRRELGRRARLHLWVPPTPNDAGIAIGAAYAAARLAGAGPGQGIEHAFYCGSPPADAEIREALDSAPDVNWTRIGDVRSASGRDAVAELMAYVTAQDGILALFQGAAETGPRALGHRSILANPCNPDTRAILNARVKFREAVRPLAPMATREAAARWFELSDGASDADYNGYNYMVLTATAKPEARARIPAVIHADGTGRIQIVRQHIDPLTHSYLKALGRRIGVEVAVNTSFNVGGPIAQTPRHAVETLRRAKGMDVVVMVAEEGTVYAVWPERDGPDGASRFQRWLGEWRAQAAAAMPEPVA
jgi:carbamoyltransferase